MKELTQRDISKIISHTLFLSLDDDAVMHIVPDEGSSLERYVIKVFPSKRKFEYYDGQEVDFSLSRDSRVLTAVTDKKTYELLGLDRIVPRRLRIIDKNKVDMVELMSHAKRGDVYFTSGQEIFTLVPGRLRDTVDLVSTRKLNGKPVAVFDEYNPLITNGREAFSVSDDSSRIDGIRLSMWRIKDKLI